MIAGAQMMVGQGLDHAAFIDHAVRTALDHALKLAPHRFQPGNAALDLGQLLAGDAVGLLAGTVRTRGQVLQRTQIIQPEAQFAAMTDEAQLLEMSIAIAALPAG